MAINKYVGAFLAIGLFDAGLLGAICISLASSWAFGEIFGWAHSLNQKVKQAPWFYAYYFFTLVLAGLFGQQGKGIDIENVAPMLGGASQNRDATLATQVFLCNVRGGVSRRDLPGTQGELGLPLAFQARQADALPEP